jgi:FeS assembly SUF system protein
MDTEPTASQQSLRDRVIEVLRSCYDPEIPVNIYELGLVYEVNVSPTNAVEIRMTLTSPMCPVAGSLPPEVEEKVSALSGVKEAKVEVVWDPPWNPSMMTEAARLELNLA